MAVEDDPRVPHDIAEQHAVMVSMALVDGARDRAHEAVDRAFSLAKTDMEATGVTWTTNVDEILNAKVAHHLQCGGIETVGQLVHYTRDELAAVHQIRYKSVDLIERALARHGFSLRRNDC